MALSWVSARNGILPANTIVAGNDTNGMTLYVARANHDGDLVPGKHIQSHNFAHVSFNGMEIHKFEYEVLCGTNYKWVASSYGNVPANAFVGGRTKTGETLYVGRADYMNSKQPGKVHKSHGAMYFPYGSVEHSATHYEVLCNVTGGHHKFSLHSKINRSIQTTSYFGGTVARETLMPVLKQTGSILKKIVHDNSTNGLKWVPARNGILPTNAIVGGTDTNGMPLYVARATHEGDLVPGKLISSHTYAHISYGGMELQKSQYDVLCGTKYKWMAGSYGNVPPSAFVGGLTRSGETLYVGRANYMNSQQPGKIHKSHGVMYYSYGGAQQTATHYEVLCTAPRGQWIPSSVHSAIPNGAHISGTDANGDIIYVGRAMHDGYQLPAKVIPSKRSATVCNAGVEISKSSFEVFCEGTVNWIQSGSGAIPKGAVSVGRNRTGETVYIGRGHFAGSLTVGKFVASNMTLYIPFGGSEVPLKSFEILVEVE